jgi:RNA polymerase sigma-70 factor, ECF subfamily
MRWSSVEKMNKPAMTSAVPANLGAEEDLVIAAKSGDEPAFETLFKRYQPRIFALALRYTRVREDAEDIVQQTFLKAFVHLHRFEGKASFCTWLTRIAINEALMLLRSGRALRQVALNDSSEDESAARGLQIPDSGPGPEMSYLQREGAQVLCAAIDELNPRMRTAIELRELAELSTQETARRMGLSVAGVKARVFHGRRKLRKILWRVQRVSARRADVTALRQQSNAIRQRGDGRCRA